MSNYELNGQSGSDPTEFWNPARPYGGEIPTATPQQAVHPATESYRDERLRQFTFDRFASEVEDTALFVGKCKAGHDAEIAEVIADTQAKAEIIRTGLSTHPDDLRVMEVAERSTYYLSAYMMDAGSVESMLAAVRTASASFYGDLKRNGLIRDDSVEALDAAFALEPAQD